MGAGAKPYQVIQSVGPDYTVRGLTDAKSSRTTTLSTATAIGTSLISPSSSSTAAAVTMGIMRQDGYGVGAAGLVSLGIAALEIYI
ncbi:hypothetical protein PG995_004062 [Apiospora arundinis]